jgi:polar amino acid transport system substrate-binding protein
MKRMSIHLAVAAVAVLMAVPAKAQEKVVFAYIEEPPFNATIDGKPQGYDIEVAKAVLSRMGIKDVEFVKKEFPDLMPGVAAGKWTMNTGLFVTPERCKNVAYSNPIWSLVDGMIVRAGNPKHITSYASVAASDARLGVVKDTVEVGRAKTAGVPPERLIEFRNQDEIIAEIKKGNVDAYAATSFGHRALLASLKDPELELAEPFEPLMKDGHPVVDFGAYSFNKANGAFIARFNVELAKFLGSEEHRAILDKYGFGPDEITPALTAKSEELCK